MVNNVEGFLKVDGSSCSVSADNVRGDIDINNSYKFVILKNTSGSIKVKGGSSPIEISNVKHLPAQGFINLETTYKNINISLPKDSKVSIFTFSKYSKIESDFPVYINKENDDKKPLNGTIIKIKSSGRIIIKEE